MQRLTSQAGRDTWVATSQPPEPDLPAQPGWVAAYWQSWRGGQRFAWADDALAQIRRLVADGLHDDAFAAACGYMARAAAAASGAGSPPKLATSWPAIATLLVEEVIGVTWSSEGVHWNLRLEPPVGLYCLTIDGNTLSLAAEADTGAGIVVRVQATVPFDLTIDTELTMFQERVPAGETRYLLTYLDRTDILTERG
ncbi:MAG: hypothetical protein KDH89_10760 [Anaerolineae bacterium]|nr:hypothetical protein [Anaerolineae bacterium]